MSPTIVTLPTSYKKYLGYSYYDYNKITLHGDKYVPTPSFASFPGIQINEVGTGRKTVKTCLRVSIFQTTLPTHCASDRYKATLLSALQSLQSISHISLSDKNKMAKAIGKSLSDYLLFDRDKHLYKHFLLNSMVWMLLLFLVSMLLLSGLAIPFTFAIYLMVLVPGAAACLGIITGVISNRISASSQLEMIYEKLTAAIERVSEHMNKHARMNKRELHIIEEASSVSSLEPSNNPEQLPFSHEDETNVLLNVTP